jgi:cytochrome c553
MVPLMEKWVERLNGWHGDRLKKPVTCTTCHAVDPKQKYGVYIPLMNSFVMALKKTPTNRNPAKNWKPLLKDPASGMLCGYCHGDIGKQMVRRLPSLLSSYGEKTPEKYASNQAFMVGMMETWMRKANVQLRDVLIKPLACLDCHDQDPRR